MFMVVQQHVRIFESKSTIKFEVVVEYSQVLNLRIFTCSLLQPATTHSNPTGEGTNSRVVGDFWPDSVGRIITSSDKLN